MQEVNHKFRRDGVHRWSTSESRTKGWTNGLIVCIWKKVYSYSDERM